MTFDYKKYSLEHLENWIHDALSCADASPQEIYDTIKKVVDENYHIYKNHTERCYELLCLLNGNGIGHIQAYDEYAKEWEIDKTDVSWAKEKLTCDKDDPSPECQEAWSDFWEEHYYPEEHKGSTVSSVNYTDEELDAMCDKAATDDEKERCREYNLRETEYYDTRVKVDVDYEKAKKWVLPVEVDGPSGEYYVCFPDDLLETANLKEGDQVEWIDNGNGSCTLRKVGLMWHPV